MKNLQMIEKRIDHPHGHLEVHSIFHTIQGEGPFAGQPAVFVRLAGCNLQCPACDTDYSSNRDLMSVAQIRSKVIELCSPSHTTCLVVLTGGEPFRQNCGDLIEHLAQADFDIQVETNGTLFDLSISTLSNYALERLSIVCSPKARINQTLRPYITHLKYVGRDGELNPDDGLPMSVLGGSTIPERPWKEFEGTVYLQPMDETDKRHATACNVEACVQSCMKHGYVLSLQLHKIVGLQ